ncbi:MAG TPA: hypothetical protein VHT05_04160 [Candidatus Elarobacter sp.]|jgi:hypothetical protein|nr:hypothetical protein [Candidatus Elarobacter sp.]
MKLVRVAWVVALVALAACGGGGSSGAKGSPGGAVPPAQSVSTVPPSPSSATSTANYTSAGGKLTFPTAGGYSGTIALTASGMLGVATMTMTSSTAIPPGVPTVLDLRRASTVRHMLSSVIAPQFFETLSSSDSVVFNTYPVLTFTVPSTITVANYAFFVASYDPTEGTQWTDLGRMGPPYHQTLSLGENTSPLIMHGNVNYVYALYSLPVEHPTSTFTSGACPLPTVAATSANGTLWCSTGTGNGFERITSSGSSAVSLPDTSYRVVFATRGSDGNVWFTAEPAVPTAGKQPEIGKIDQSSAAITTYAVPNPSSSPTANVTFNAGPITSGPTSLYFLVSTTVAYGSPQTYLETAGTTGAVTHSAQLSYGIQGVDYLSMLTYASDGNVWLGTPTQNNNGPAELITKIAPSTGAATNYTSPTCVQTIQNLVPPSFVQGGDGNLYFATAPYLGFTGLCTLTLAGQTTVTPVAPLYATSVGTLSNLTVATDGSVWYSVPDGVGRIESGTVAQYADPALHDVSQGVFGMPSGALWETGKFPSAPGVQVLNPASP